MVKMDWEPLHKRFLKLSEKTGISKASSYQMIVSFEQDGSVSVELGGYDIGSWDRYTHVGYFKNESLAYSATLSKIEDAEKIVAGTLAKNG